MRKSRNCSGASCEVFAGHPRFFVGCRGSEKLSPNARRICEQTVSPLFISVGAGKLSIPQPEVTLPGWVARMNMQILPLEAAHAYAL